MTARMPRLSAGDLRTKIEILRETTVDNGHNEDVSRWAVVAQPFAEVLGQNGREAIIGQVLQGVSVYRIRMRYRADFTAADQIRLDGPGGTDLNIMGPPADPNGDREQIMVWASTASAVKTTNA